MLLLLLFLLLELSLLMLLLHIGDECVTKFLAPTMSRDDLEAALGHRIASDFIAPTPADPQFASVDEEGKRASESEASGRKR